MGTFLAFLVAIAKLFYAQPWSKILLLCFAVFVGGCIYGRRMRAEAPPVRVIQPERRPIFPRLREEPTEAPKLVPVPDAISTPKLPEAANHFVDANKKAPVASASACQPGQACYRPQASRQSSRGLFRRWR
jgi:hypothetical protein